VFLPSDTQGFFAAEPIIGLQRLKLLTGESLLLVSNGATFHLSDDALAACLSDGDLAVRIQRIFDEVMKLGAAVNFSAVAIPATEYR